MDKFLKKQLLLLIIVGLSLTLPVNAMEMLDIEELNYSHLKSHFHSCPKVPEQVKKVKKPSKTIIGGGPDGGFIQYSPSTRYRVVTPASKCQQSGKESFCLNHSPTAQLELDKINTHLINVGNKKNWAVTILQTTPEAAVREDESGKANLLIPFHHSCAIIPNGCQQGLYYWCLNNNPDAAPWFRLESAHLILVRNEINAIETGIPRIRPLP